MTGSRSLSVLLLLAALGFACTSAAATGSSRRGQGRCGAALRGLRRPHGLRLRRQRDHVPKRWQRSEGACAARHERFPRPLQQHGMVPGWASHRAPEGARSGDPEVQRDAPAGIEPEVLLSLDRLVARRRAPAPGRLVDVHRERRHLRATPPGPSPAKAHARPGLRPGHVHTGSHCVRTWWVDLGDPQPGSEAAPAPPRCRAQLVTRRDAACVRTRRRHSHRLGIRTGASATHEPPGRPRADLVAQRRTDRLRPLPAHLHRPQPRRARPRGATRQVSESVLGIAVVAAGPLSPQHQPVPVGALVALPLDR